MGGYNEGTGGQIERLINGQNKRIKNVLSVFMKAYDVLSISYAFLVSNPLREGNSSDRFELLQGRYLDYE